MIHEFKSEKETGAETYPAIACWIVTGDAPSATGQFLPLSLTAIPEVFSKVNLAQKLTRFQLTYHEQTNVQKCYTLE